MSMIRGVLFSVGCAAAGAALWVALSHWTGYRLGVMAIIVGGLAGFGMLSGVAGRGRATAGLLAAVVTAGAVVASRYAEHHLMVSDMMAQETEVSDDEVICSIADEVGAEYEAAGRELNWSDEGPAAEAGYADEVWQGANLRWISMTPDTREQLRAAIAAQWKAEAQQARPVVELVGFVIGFGLFDLAWLGLAVSTAFKIGSTDAKARAESQAAAAAEDAGPPEGAGFWGSLGKPSEAAPVRANQGAREAA